MSSAFGMPEILFLLPFILLILPFYFAPLVVALFRGHRLKWRIAVINLFLGWTVIGWIVALVMAVSPAKPQ